MISLVDIPSKHLEALSQVFAHAALSMDEKHPNGAHFLRDLAGMLASELDSRDLFGIRTAGHFEVVLPSRESLSLAESIAICDVLSDWSEDHSNPAVRELLDSMVYEWFRDVETY